MMKQFSAHHRHTIAVWSLVQHSLSSFDTLVRHFGDCETALEPQNLAKWQQLKLHANHLKRAAEYATPAGQAAFSNLLAHIQQHTDFIVTPEDPLYPAQLMPYTGKPPILFGRGSAQPLLQPQIAVVGSRKPSPHGRQVAYDFAYYLGEKGFYITSGLAHGIDEAAHQGSVMQQRAIAVVGTGLDRCYPAGNRTLYESIASQGGAVVSEFLPGTPPLKANFPRRNRIVSGLSLGVLVVEAKKESGSLITANRAAEQGKTVFAIPGHIYSEFHQGCHQLIREGAILVDHPEQILEDLALPTHWHAQSTAAVSATSTPEDVSDALAVPEELIPLYQRLDWTGQDLDQLAQQFEGSTAELTGQLMELELLGLCIQQSGRYLRCTGGF